MHSSCACPLHFQNILCYKFWNNYKSVKIKFKCSLTRVCRTYTDARIIKVFCLLSILHKLVSNPSFAPSSKMDVSCSIGLETALFPLTFFWDLTIWIFPVRIANICCCEAVKRYLFVDCGVFYNLKWKAPNSSFSFLISP